MKLFLNWIQDFVDIDIINKDQLHNVVVGHVEKVERHPDADKLNVAQVNVGEDELRQIVCGAPNLVENTHVVVALPGAILPGAFEIQKSKLRGVESNGMICGIDEIGLGESKEWRHIWILDDDKDWTPGTPLLEALGLDKAHSPQELGDLITRHTAEVEGVIPADKWLHNVVSGKLLSFEQVEGSDKLSLGKFDIGWKSINVIFGKVHKVDVGDILPIALPGAVLPGGTIKRTEMAGVTSEGMVCADDELGIENDPHGLTRLPEGTPLGKPLADLLELRGFALDIDNKSLTHRPDLWGHYGFARELSALLKLPLKPISELTQYKAGSEDSKVNVQIQDTDICPRFSSAVMTGIKIEQSPQWMKARLQAAGMNPINNLVDVTNFVMLELGHPMHAYDRKVVGEDAFIVRKAKAGEKLLTLEGEEHEIPEGSALVCDSENTPIGIAGIKGGKKSGISDETTEVILEAAHWDPISIRKTSTAIGLRTDASQRFEKGLDPAGTEKAVARAVALLQEICPNSKLVSPIETTGPRKPEVITIELSPDSVNRKIGVEISTERMAEILESLEFDVEKSEENLKVKVPSHRASGDVSLEEDLVEEIARVYGYDQIPAILPHLPINLPVENSERRYKHQVRRILAHQLGFTELMNYSFYGRDIMEKSRVEEEGHIKVLNYLSEDQTHMRRSLIPNMLEKVERNGADRNHMKLFELGHVYHEKGNYMPQEEKWLAGMVASTDLAEPFYSAKGALEAFLESFLMGKTQLRPAKEVPPYAHPKKALTILHRGKAIGHVFTLHPAAQKAFNLEHEVAAFELNFSDLVANEQQFADFNAPARFPGMSFDISVLVDKRCEVATIEKTIRSADKQRIVQSVTLFDTYEGEHIPENQKSLSFSVDLRHDERTLTEAEFQECQGAVFLALEQMGGKIRGK